VHAFIRGEGLEAYYRRREGAPAAGGPTVLAAVDPAPFAPLVRMLPDGAAQIDFTLEGIRCAACTWLIERVLARTAGVAFARVSYATHRARVRWDPAAVTLAAILLRVRATGYAPKPFSESERLLARRAEERDLLVRFGTAAFLSSQLMIYSAALYAGYFQGMDPGTHTAMEWIALALTVPVLLYAGLPLLRATLAGLRRGRFPMDALVVLGAWSAFAASVHGMIRGGEVYFDTAAMIVTLVLLGRFLELRAKGRASEALERLAELSPRTAERVTLGEDGAVISRTTVAVAALRVGDALEVRPGEKYAADGTVLAGESTADESLLTGEAKPVRKVPGAPVIGGSVNRFGTLVFTVTRTGRDTVLAKIVDAIEDAQASRPPVQILADRVVGVFVPAILLLAALTAAWHLRAGEPAERALLAGVAVLVIACPCSLGLATPLAVLVHSSLASAGGVLTKGGEVIEQAAGVRRAIFDKTGTLTVGALVVRELVPTPGAEAAEALRLAASVESRSEHVIGAALVEAARGRTLARVTAFEAIPGLGVRGVADGRRVLVGNRAFLAGEGVAMAGADGLGADRAAPATGSLTPVYAAVDGALALLVLLADGLRPEAPATVAALRAAGVAVSLVSGDEPTATSAAARGAGIEEFEAGALPVRKRELVRRFQAAGEGVLMIGDGINDAPALAEARLGIAMGRGTDIAMESAGAVLVRPDLRLVPWLVHLSRATRRVIRQNIFWAFFYNLLAIPLAMAGLLHPIVAAAAMAASSLFVVGNSLRIRRLAGAPPGPEAAVARERGTR
jgi:Cu2+-exporting ATPase